MFKSIFRKKINMKECESVYGPNRASKVVSIYLLLVISFYLCNGACAVVQPHIMNASLFTTCFACEFIWL